MSKQGKILLSIAVFLFLCLAIWVIRTTPDAPPEQEEAEVPKIMSYDGNILSEERNGRKLWDLTADTSVVDLETQDSELTGIVGHFYMEDGKILELRAKHGIYRQKQKEVLLDGDIVVTISDGAKLTSDRLEWYEGKDLLTAIGNAKITKDDLLAEGDRIESTNGYQHFRIVGHAHLVKGNKGEKKK